MIRGITYNKQSFKSNDYALMTRRFFNNEDGIIKGCELSISGSNVVIAKGWFVANGYYTNISSQELVSLSNGTLVYEIDLSKENTTTSFNQGSFKIITTTPTKEDLFNDGTLYQMPIATISNGAISETIWGDLLSDYAVQISTINDNISNINTDISNINTNISSLTSDISLKQNKITYGTSDPSGGSDGDIYIKYS